eukprot:TRINITY_DN17319_c0_g1_i2.p1 TRINITY_DN17319_c0_g1~~TRINITY_DN17319_c0_g1_i2.p1  ORF type:complete len:240 (-),score=25.71 TRINITY_DN17319_c0_g1_i2:32-751(-)
MGAMKPFYIGKNQIQYHKRWINYASQHDTIQRLISEVTIGSGIELVLEDVYINKQRKLQIFKPKDLDAVMVFYIDNNQNHLDPYWAVIWPSAQAMANHIFNNEDLVRGKRVVELGSGLGLGGISAAICGAKQVVLLDRERMALQCSLLNAAVNGLQKVQNPTNFGKISLPENFKFDIKFLTNEIYDDTKKIINHNNNIKIIIDGDQNQNKKKKGINQRIYAKNGDFVQGINIKNPFVSL